MREESLAHKMQIERNVRIGHDAINVQDAIKRAIDAYMHMTLFSAENVQNQIIAEIEVLRALSARNTENFTTCIHAYNTYRGKYDQNSEEL